MKIIELLHGLGLRAAYGRFEKKQPLPFAVYYGEGQQHFFGDNTIQSKVNDYTIEYYFRDKDSKREDEIEEALLDDDYIYSKSEDVYIEEERAFVIYYTVWRKQNG